MNTTLKFDKQNTSTRYAVIYKKSNVQEDSRQN